MLVFCFTGNAQNISFSQERGYYSSGFPLTLSSDIPGASIRYTTDGSVASTTNGILYSGSININNTSIISAIAFNTTESSKMVSHTYLFTNDILNQTGMLDTFNVEMQDNVISTYQNDIVNSFSEILSVSLVMPIDSLFDAARGIYTNPQERGFDWERVTSVEIIDPNGIGAQVNAGIRIHGATTRNYRKKSFRLYFRSDYGDSKLKYQLYNDPQATDKFDHLVLHQGGHQDTFVGFISERATYTKNRFANELLLDMNHITSHGRYAHLYINGIYWGLYHLLERPNADFFSDYMGGDEEDYDVIKGDVLSGPEIVDGNDIYWNQMLSLATAGLESDAAYSQFQQYINLESFIDYIVLSQTLGNRDWDNHNWIAARNAKKNEPFIFVNWDSDAIWDGLNREDDLVTFHYYKNYENMPTYIFRQLQNNEQFRCLLADRITMHFDSGGVLSPSHMQTVFNQVSSEINLSFKTEAARWGNNTNINQWIDRVNYISNDWLVNRTGIVKNYYQTYDVLNTESIPAISLASSYINAGQQISLNGTTNIYYTLDGTDPKGNDSNPSTSAMLYNNPLTINNHTKVLARSMSSSNDCNLALYKPTEQSSILNYGMLGAHFSSRANDGIIDDRSEWLNYGGSVAITEVSAQPWWQIDLQKNAYIDQIDIYAPDCCDAGLSNFHVIVSNQPFTSNSLSTTLSQPGVSSFFLNDCIGSCSVNIGGFGQYVRIQLTGNNHSLNIAEVEIQGTTCNKWSSLESATYYLNQNLSSILINEIHYNPVDSITALNDTIDGDSFEFIEIHNTSNLAIDLSDVYFSAGISYRFPFGTIIQPNEYLVLAENISLFSDKYGFSAFAQYDGKLSNGGEMIELVDPFGNLIDRVIYNDSTPWTNGADGTGYSLALLPNQTNNDNANNWSIQNTAFTPKAENDFCFPISETNFPLPVACNGDATGSLIVIPSGGTSPYSYNWQNGQTTQTLSNVIAGNYQLTITDAYNCLETFNFIISEPPSIVLSEVHADESVAGANNGVINLAVNGGTAPYTYSWSNGATTQDINNLSPGTYTVTVLDANGCTENLSITILPGITPCAIPSNIQAGNIQNASATLSWSPNSNASNYDIQYRILGGSSWTTFSTTYAFAILNNLNTCTNYEVRIKSSCSNGLLSSYSPIYNFQTIGCIAPCATVTGLFSQNITTSILFTLPSCTDFEWYVEVNCVNGQISNASPIANFTTVGAACKNVTDNELLEQSSNINFVKVFPNPTSNILNLTFNSSVETESQLSIFNSLGQLVLSKSIQIDKYKNYLSFNATEFTAGNYWIQITSDKFQAKFQFIKD